MKRVGNLYQKIISMENLSYAFDRATNGKKWRDNIQEAIAHKSEIISKIHSDLANHTYHTSPYKTKTIYEPKERIIYVLPFAPDRIVHHAIMRIIEPIFERKLLYDTYACRIGKGQIKASNRCLEYVKKYRYVLQLDISKFYPSINHQILKQILRKIFKDTELLTLLDEIIDSVGGEVNVPIGNYLSQWFGNIYLNSLDRFIAKNNFHKFVRYCDDVLVFSDDKDRLRELKEKVYAFVTGELKLTLSRADVIKTTKGIKFLGYRHFPNGYKLLKKKTVLRIKERLKQIPYIYKVNPRKLPYLQGQLASALGWFKHCNSFRLQRSLNITHLCKLLNVQKDLVVQDIENLLEPKEQLGIVIPISILIDKAAVFYGSKLCKKKNKEFLRLHYKLINPNGIQSKKVYVTFTESKRLMYLFNKYDKQLPFTAKIHKTLKAYSLVSIYEDFTMRGFPKHLNSKSDYMYIKTHFDKALWLPEFQKLLDTYKDWFFVSELESKDDGITDDTHKIVESTQDDKTTYSQYELQINPTAKIFRIGFTVDEVTEIINAA